MTAKKVTTKKKAAIKETVSNEITGILTAGLSKFKESLGKKKFEKKIRKAVKIFTQSIKPAEAKKAVPKKAAPAKTKKKTAKLPAKKAAVIPAKKS